MKFSELSLGYSIVCVAGKDVTASLGEVDLGGTAIPRLHLYPHTTPD